MPAMHPQDISGPLEVQTPVCGLTLDHLTVSYKQTARKDRRVWPAILQPLGQQIKSSIVVCQGLLVILLLLTIYEEVLTGRNGDAG